jgi:hypothetical protein
MRPLVPLLLAISSLLLAAGVAAASEENSASTARERAIAIWDGHDSPSDAGAAEAAPGSEDLARYAQRENETLHDALAVDMPKTEPLPLAITSFSSDE